MLTQQRPQLCTVAKSQWKNNLWKCLALFVLHYLWHLLIDNQENSPPKTFAPSSVRYSAHTNMFMHSKSISVCRESPADVNLDKLGDLCDYTHLHAVCNLTYVSQTYISNDTSITLTDDHHHHWCFVEKQRSFGIWNLWNIPVEIEQQTEYVLTNILVSQ